MCEKKLKLTRLALVCALYAFACQSSFAATPEKSLKTTMAELAALQNTLDSAIKRLDADGWKKREAAEKELRDTLLARPVALNYVIAKLRSEKAPEVKFRLRNALKSYYLKAVNPVAGKRGFIGLQLTPVIFLQKPDGQGKAWIRIAGVEHGLPGEKAGIETGDIILETDGKEMSVDKFIAYIAGRGPGRVVTLKIYRGANTLEKKVTLAERPKELHDPLEGKTAEAFFKEWLAARLRHKR